MDLDAILSFVRDVLVLGYMFIVRVGVPIIITLMIGAWLRRLIEEREKPAEQPSTSSTSHCWDKSQTPETSEARAISANRPDLPCWLALQVSGPGLKEMCYSCPVYSKHATAPVRA